MHIFLTGERQTGKSTVIEKTVELLGARPGGFVSRKMPGGLYLFHYGNKDDGTLVARRREEAPGYEPDPLAFDKVGEKYLADGAPLIIMDELGYLEANAWGFQREVFRVLSGDKPVLGALRLADKPFLNKVQERPDVKVLLVTEDNRDSLPKTLAEMLK